MGLDVLPDWDLVLPPALPRSSLVPPAPLHFRLRGGGETQALLQRIYFFSYSFKFAAKLRGKYIYPLPYPYYFFFNCIISFVSINPWRNALFPVLKKNANPTPTFRVIYASNLTACMRKVPGIEYKWRWKYTDKFSCLPVLFCLFCFG